MQMTKKEKKDRPVHNPITYNFTKKYTYFYNNSSHRIIWTWDNNIFDEIIEFNRLVKVLEVTHFYS